MRTAIIIWIITIVSINLVTNTRVANASIRITSLDGQTVSFHQWSDTTGRIEIVRCKDSNGRFYDSDFETYACEPAVGSITNVLEGRAFFAVFDKELNKIDKSRLSPEQRTLLESDLTDPVNIDAKKRLTKIFSQLLDDMSRLDVTHTLTEVQDGATIAYNVLNAIVSIGYCNPEKVAIAPAGHLCFAESGSPYLSIPRWKQENNLWEVSEDSAGRRVYYNIEDDFRVTAPLPGMFSQQEASKICSKAGYRLPTLNADVPPSSPQWRENEFWKLNDRGILNVISEMEGKQFWSATPVTKDLKQAYYFDGSKAAMFRSYFDKTKSPRSVLCTF